MHHYIAFLRGMNLGNRRIKMDALRSHFEALQFDDVETFIASGNVIFSSRQADSAKLETTIQIHLEKTLGYAVSTFVRTRVEVSAVATFRPFSAADMDPPENTVHCGFLQAALTHAQARGLAAFQSQSDAFRVNAREYYWLCRRIPSHESKVWSSPELKTLKLPLSSLRNLTTVRKLATLYPALAT